MGSFKRCFGCVSESTGVSNELQSEKEEVVEAEPLHPRQNPILQGYMLPGVHGTYRRYVMELFVVAGMLVPWLAPLFGLTIMTPIILLTVQNGKVIRPDSDCFGGGIDPVTCSASSFFDYYFWNITNPQQFLAGSEPPALKEIGPYVFLVEERRWNITFSSDFSTVNYSSLNFQTFVPEQSCSGCSLTSDYLVTVNRGYLAFLASPLINYNDALAFIPFVPTAMRQIVVGIQGALIAGGVPAGFAATATVQQWGRAAYGYPAMLTGVEDPTNPGFANWVHVYQGFAYAAASAVLTDAQAAQLLTLFQGNPALDTPAGPDGGLNVALFAFYPAAAVVGVLSTYYPTLGLGIPQVQLIQGYLFWACQNLIVPSALYGGPTGELLGPSAGGMLVRRSVNDWIYGWQDPLIRQNVSMAFAFSGKDAAASTFGVPTEQLSHEYSPLIFEYSLDTGRAVNTQPFNALVVDSSKTIFAYPNIQLPYGSIPIRGSAGGLNFPRDVRPNTRLEMYDATFNRPLNVSYTGEKVSNQGISSWLFSLVDNEIGECNFSAPTERCAYPDVYSHTFNATLTYNCPTVLSFPHYYKADPALPASTGFDFAPNREEHEWGFSIEPVSGFATTGRKGYQINHLVKRSTFLYPSLWLNTSSSIDGMWLPTFWARSRFQPAAADAQSLRSGLALRGGFRIYPAYVVPPISAFLLAVGVIFLGLTKGAKRTLKECSKARQSRARTIELNAEELVSVRHIPDFSDANKETNRSSILKLEEMFGDFWSGSVSPYSSPRDLDFTPRQYSTTIPDGEY